MRRVQRYGGRGSKYASLHVLLDFPTTDFTNQSVLTLPSVRLQRAPISIANIILPCPQDLAAF